jgi:hypothetical protein
VKHTTWAPLACLTTALLARVTLLSSVTDDVVWPCSGKRQQQVTSGHLAC